MELFQSFSALSVFLPPFWRMVEERERREGQLSLIKKEDRVGDVGCRQKEGSFSGIDIWEEEKERRYNMEGREGSFFSGWEN